MALVAFFLAFTINWHSFFSHLNPFHHEPKPETSLTIDEGDTGRTDYSKYVTEDMCDEYEGKFYYSGTDGVIGIGASCKLAFMDWETIKSPFTSMHMNRS